MLAVNDSMEKIKALNLIQDLEFVWISSLIN